MRFITAAVLFVMSALLILTGVAERTIWMPSPLHIERISISSKTPLVLVKNSVLEQFPEAPTFTVSGDSGVWVASGRQSDIKAWVGNTPHLELSAVTTASETHVFKQTFGGAQLSADPRGSDLWTNEWIGDRVATDVIRDTADQGLLIATDGFARPPAELKLTWANPFDPTPSRNLFIFGGALLLLATILNFWAWYTMRRDRGPRRRTPKAPQGPRTRRRRLSNNAPVRGRRSVRNFTAVIAGGLVLATLTGCAHSPVTSASPSPSASQNQVANPVMTEGQMRVVIDRIAAVVASADAQKDAKLLPQRVSGPALTSRTAYYTLEKASKKISAPVPIATKVIKVALPEANNQWPRTAMAITSNGDADSLPQMLVMQQDSPREQYHLWYYIDMLPGITFPLVTSAATGATPVAADSLFLKVAPNALVSAFGDLIDNGPLSTQADNFSTANDEYYNQIYQSQQNQKKALKNATVTVTHAMGSQNVVALATVNSGALVAIYMNDQYVIKPKKATQAVAVAGNEKILLGSAGSTSGIRSTYGSMLLFYVPASGSKDRIQTLGATQVLLSVRGL